MQKSLKIMLVLLLIAVMAAVVLGGLFVRSRWNARQERIAENERIENMVAEEIQITFLPGRSMFAHRRMLMERGFEAAEIDAAFRANYDVMARLGRPTTLGPRVTTEHIIGARDLINDSMVSIEGFLFPETINFFANTSVQNIVNRMALELERAVQREGLVAAFAEHNLSFYEGLILASIVEGEVDVRDPDAARVAAVFHNRLRHNWALGADISSLYAANLMGVATQHEDGSPNHAILQLCSPWNTRSYECGRGLPPTPINSPSLAALRITANPAPQSLGRDFYFLTGDSGRKYFARTLPEHQRNIREHCRVRCQNW
ncbi:endolytic transglycosylase MltG [Candidatus Saccharibacteria bacterium]|nr:endolytic transglycosylase MltG [Candidatus Saccharibacteria bacterium]